MTLTPTIAPAIAPADLAHCRAAIRTGSRSFHAASRLLPGAVRDPALVLYAFCRLADDAVDEHTEKARAVLSLSDRLDLAYAGRPRNAPEDRAFAAIIESFEMPRALPEALLEGLAWDAQVRTYRTLSDIRAYSARVAAAVGAMMCVLMRVRDSDALARACDLGVAMQLTNIARDVGEDARAGRLYLPLDWMEQAGIAPKTFLADPLPTPEIRRMTARLIAEAERLYRRSEAGIARLPPAARTGIWAARLIYAGIGTQVRRAGCDSVSHRAHTSSLQKSLWMAQAALRAAGSTLMPEPAVIYAPPLPETAYLVAAAGRASPRGKRTQTLLAILADLKSRDARLGSGPQQA
jgi:phytoene synthase